MKTIIISPDVKTCIHVKNSISGNWYTEQHISSLIIVCE